MSDLTAFLIVELDADGEQPLGPHHRVRRDREDLHQPVRSSGRRTTSPGRWADGDRDTASTTRRSSAELETRALEGLDLVVASIERTNEAVQHQDIELAELVIATDDVIDGRYLEVHQSILTLLATQAPVASDLRLISALLHVMKCMERMGDQCVNVAKLIPLAGHEPPADERMLADILTMGRSVREQVRQSKRAFSDARRRARPRPRPPGRHRRQPQPRVLPPRDRDRRLRGPPRVGDDDDADRPRDRAHRRQRRRHRRAGRVRRHRALPRVRGRLAPGRGRRPVPPPG